MSISRRLHFIVATLLTVGLLGLVGAGVLWFSRAQLTKKIIERYLEQESIVALQTAQTAKDDIDTSHSYLNALADLPEIYGGNSDACNAILKNAIPFIPKHIDNISFLDAAGIVTCSTDQKIVGLNLTIFDNAVREIIVDSNHKPTLGELSFSPGEVNQTISFYEPVRNAQGVFVGALKAGTKISTIRARYEQNPAFNFVGNPILLDDTGSVLYSSNQDLLNINVTTDEVVTSFIDKNTLLQILQVSERKEAGSLEYSMNRRNYSAVHRRIDVLPGHSWTFILAIATDDIQGTLFPDAYRYIKALMIGNVVFVIVTLLLFMLYVSRNLIRKEVMISDYHDDHMKEDLGAINVAFGKVTQGLAKLEEHISRDMNTLHVEAEKRQEKIIEDK